MAVRMRVVLEFVSVVVGGTFGVNVFVEGTLVKLILGSVSGSYARAWLVSDILEDMKGDRFSQVTVRESPALQEVGEEAGTAPERLVQEGEGGP